MFPTCRRTGTALNWRRYIADRFERETFKLEGARLRKLPKHHSRIDAMTAIALALALCLWGNPVTILDRMPSGRAGYDAVFVKKESGAPFFVLIEKDRNLKPCH